MNTMKDMGTKKCPYCAETIMQDAIKCRFCGSWLDKEHYLTTWTRSRTHGKIAGVCAGLARQLSIPVLYIRLAFILFTIFGGWGLVLYIVLWFLMPQE